MSIAEDLRSQLPDRNHGLTDIEVYSKMSLPTDYEITEVLGDIIMAEYVDCDDDGQLVNRGGILVNNDVTRNTWRVAKILKRGKGCSDIIQEGKLIMFPNDKGIPSVTQNKKPAVFINEERIFGICEVR